MSNELIGIISNEGELEGVLEDNSFNVKVQITESGPRGLQGIPGNDGYTPVKGVDYFDGKDGKDGKDGYTPIKGIDYFDGEKGDKGEAGIDGVDGSDANVTKTNVEAALGYKIVFYTEGQTIPSLPTNTIAFIREV